ncbi:MAG: ribosome biogenesis GTPase Der [Patescibacteria group bacterium]|nr:ribosome biogenesis GTPase Der [Patescibacteria group bacterium]
MNKTNKQFPLVVIFGRANVGKSTLFNCLVEKQQALVSKIEGTTRDSNIGRVNWQGKIFKLIDTGGIIDLKYLSKNSKLFQSASPPAGGADSKFNNDIEAKVQQQARDYLKQADLILFLVDNKTGLLPQDKQMALFIKKLKLKDKIILTANKVDNIKQLAKTAEFHKLSLGEPMPVSAANGSGTGDLLDIIIKKLEARKIFSIDNQSRSIAGTINNLISVCIIGKPNVGKSSLLNSILGYQRVIVSPIPHTTREPQDTNIIYQNQNIALIDTAGISKKGKKAKGLEKYGISKSLSALKKSDIALLVLNISKDITHQDAKLVEEIVERKKSLIFIANKWDKIQEKNTKQYTNYIYAKLPFAKFAPIQFTSALTGEKTIKALDLAIEIYKQRQKQLSDSQLSHFLSRVVKLHKPAKAKGAKHPRIYELKQVRTNPPKFELRIGAKDNLHFSYLRFIENRLREKYGFLGTPITIKIVKGRNIYGKYGKSK